MPDIDAQLVQRIADQVMAALGQHGTNVQARRAEVHPPIGVCTGDYSQFPELQAMARAGASEKSKVESRKSESTTPDVQGPTIQPLTGFITGRQVDAVSGGIVYLAFGAKLTPLAKDRIKERGLTIQRVTAGRKVAANPGVAASGSWAWWIDGRCPAVAKLVAERKHLSQCPEKQLPAAIKRLANAIKTGKRDGGIYFVPSAARVACLANRCPSMRAVVGTCGQAVEEGIELLGANVLILEYPHHGYAAMSAMVDRFTAARREAPADVAAALKELASCG